LKKIVPKREILQKNIKKFNKKEKNRQGNLVKQHSVYMQTGKIAGVAQRGLKTQKVSEF
jgi:hypothetical protein